MEKIFECVDLCKTFQKGRKRIEAVKNASFSIGKGEIISLVGESGSGKSTLANLMLRFLKPTGGEAFLDGKKIEDYRKKEYWKKVQAIFQDPFSSFNDFFSVKKILERAIKISSYPAPDPSPDPEEKRIREAVEAVNIRYEEICDKKPFELSGGQKQRLMIARIYLIKPEMLIADEPTSMIDAVLRAGILELLLKLRGTTIMLITHDLALAYYISDRMLIMQNGRIVEEGKPQKILEAPEHPYTKKLIEDVPRLSERWL